ncbi:MAG: VWA domain-containing protein [Deltaproteobacteria bacterium]|nr:VWA domain-containing protein [Deltaproteobacteria bacterium]
MLVNRSTWAAITLAISLTACGSGKNVAPGDATVIDTNTPTDTVAAADEGMFWPDAPDAFDAGGLETDTGKDVSDLGGDTRECYPDEDHDGVPVLGEALIVAGSDTPCPQGYAPLLPFGTGLLLDCDDHQPAVHPGAPEKCNDIDENCNGDTDEGLLNSCITTCGEHGESACVHGEWAECLVPGTECCPGALKDIIPCPPFDFIFVTDDSGSMSSSDPDDIRFEAIGLFIEGMDNDLALIVGFDDSPWKYGYFTDDKNDLKTFLAQAKQDGSGGGTDIDEALYFAYDLFMDSGRQKVIILLTDGQDSYNTQEVRLAAEAKGIRIYILGLGDGVDEDTLKQTITSDGEYFFAGAAKDIMQIYDHIFSITNYQSWKVCNDEGKWVKMLGACD